MISFTNGPFHLDRESFPAQKARLVNISKSIDLSYGIACKDLKMQMIIYP